MMPWPLTRAELELAGGALRVRRISLFEADEDPRGPHWLAEFYRG